MALSLIAGALLTAGPSLPVTDALRLPSGEPLVCIYYFPNWWEPWKSDDAVVRADFRRLRSLGFNTVLLDHEWSQAIDGNWALLDRAHELARAEGIKIVPWLSAKTWSDMGIGGRPQVAREWFGVDLVFGQLQDGTPSVVQPWDDATIRAGAAYAAMYLERYTPYGTILEVLDDVGPRQVVSLSVEQAWVGPSSFDEGTNTLFARWLRNRYEDIGALNAAWGTSYSGFFEVDPKDTAVFDYQRHQAGGSAHPAAVEDHIEFRSGLVSDSLERQKHLLRRTHPEALILAEVPYQFASRHPHAEDYRISYGCNPSICDYADMVLFRNTGLLDNEEAEYLRTYRTRTGKPVVLTWRTYSDWGIARDDQEAERIAELIARQAAELGSGLGYYSWNEMVDVHLVAPGPGSPVNEFSMEPEVAERAIEFVGRINDAYLRVVGMG